MSFYCQSVALTSLNSVIIVLWLFSFIDCTKLLLPVGNFDTNCVNSLSIVMFVLLIDCNALFLLGESFGIYCQSSEYCHIVLCTYRL